MTIKERLSQLSFPTQVALVLVMTLLLSTGLGLGIRTAQHSLDDIKSCRVIQKELWTAYRNDPSQLTMDFAGFESSELLNSRSRINISPRFRQLTTNILAVDSTYFASEDPGSGKAPLSPSGIKYAKQLLRENRTQLYRLCNP